MLVLMLMLVIPTSVLLMAARLLLILPAVSNKCTSTGFRIRSEGFSSLEQGVCYESQTPLCSRCRFHTRHLGKRRKAPRRMHIGRALGLSNLGTRACCLMVEEATASLVGRSDDSEPLIGFRPEYFLRPKEDSCARFHWRASLNMDEVIAPLWGMGDEKACSFGRSGQGLRHGPAKQRLTQAAQCTRLHTRDTCSTKPLLWNGK